MDRGQNWPYMFWNRSLHSYRIQVLPTPSLADHSPISNTNHPSLKEKNVKLLKEVDEVSGVCVGCWGRLRTRNPGLQFNLLIVACGASSVGILPSNIPFVDLLSWNWGSFQTLNITYATPPVWWGSGHTGDSSYTRVGLDHVNNMLSLLYIDLL
jgi:hypothetical protein